MKIDLYSKNGDKTGQQIEVNDDVFSVEINQHCIWLSVKSEMASLRQGTHGSKTRAMVSGGGIKPWRQKGTGRSRVGSTRNPARVHGGVAFGPQPHEYRVKINKKAKAIARRSALTEKFNENAYFVVDNLDLDAPKTKQFNEIMKSFKLIGKKVTVITASEEDNLWLAARNIKELTIIPADSVSTYDILDNDVLFFDRGGIEVLNNQLEN